MTSHNKAIFPMILAMTFSFLLLFCGVQSARAYEVTRYKGHLTIKEDNSATFEQELVYKYDDTYNGQYVSLGTAGNMPDGFGILESQLQYRVYKNGQLVSTSYPDELEESGKVTFENLGDGYRLKIYNRVKDGDVVKIQVSWPIQNMLFPYQDIAELNWVPISDWEVPLNNISIRITAPDYQDSQMAVHTGYLKEAAAVTKSGQDYQITLNRLGSEKRLELHGYWDSGIVSGLDSGAFYSENNLANYQQTEANIKRYSNLVKITVYGVLPLAALIACGIDSSRWIRFRNKNDLRTKMLKDTRLYEAPSDLRPMLVARIIYNVDIRDVNPASSNRAKIDFDHISQATILDLIDRGNLGISEQGNSATLTYKTDRGISPSERVFLDMAFGKERTLPMEHLFKDFSAEQNVIQTKRKSQEKAIRESGRQLVKTYNTAFKKLRQVVENEKNELGLKPYYRNLTANKKKDMGAIGRFTAIVFMLTLLAYFGLLFFFSTHVWILLLILVVSFVVLSSINRSKVKLTSDGILTETGLEQYQLWESFKNMLRDIGRFDKTELGAIVLWNRILVYATLFGYAKEVSRVLKKYNIQIPNPDLNAYV
ncbi:DUF2207 domain-containing protein, partial [Streptococcus merionis]|uniref:DUF2207 domain-containing protein n=1 Tax=Streptococcus merionis TaxID=400065 RepID=UPI0026E9DC73